MTIAISDDLLAGLGGFAGRLLLPGDPGYEHARGVYNASIDRRPALIARCQGIADIAAVLLFARENGLEISVRGGGHGIAGRSVTDGGVMIDLSRMKGVHVDPHARRARAQAGVTWGELDRETQVHGLAVTGGVVSSTGIAGLTLGGGIGWTMGKYGLTIDNLVSAQLVTAGGSILEASEDENEDLFWGLRGGGGNFGVVASFEYRLHPVGPIVTGGLVAHPYEAAEEVLRFYREFAAGAPDELSVQAALIHAPDGSGAKMAGVAVCHLGAEEQAERDIAPLLGFGSPVQTLVGPMPYTELNRMLDAAYPAGVLNYWKSSFLEQLTDDAIATIVERFASCPSPMSSLVLEAFHGAVTRVPATATAFPHRQPSHNFMITSLWTDPAETDDNVGWTREAFAAMEPFLAPRRYVNYLQEEAGDDAARAAYGANYARLREVKARYDPDNVFRLNVNIRPRGR